MGQKYKTLKKVCPICGGYKKESSFHKSIGGVRVCSGCYHRWRKLLEELNLESFFSQIERNISTEIEIELVEKG